MYQKGFAPIILLTLITVVGVAAYYLTQVPLKTSQNQKNESAAQLSTPLSSSKPSVSPKTGTPIVRPTNLPDWSTKKTVNISTCNFSVQLPAQSSYAPTESQNLRDQSQRANKWSIEEKNNEEINVAPGIFYDQSVSIGFLPDGLPRSAFACGPGCVSEASTFVYCKRDSQTTDQIANDFEESIKKYGGFIQRRKLNLVGNLPMKSNRAIPLTTLEESFMSLAKMV